MLHREPAQARAERQPRRLHHARSRHLQRRVAQIRAAGGRRGHRHVRGRPAPRHHGGGDAFRALGENEDDPTLPDELCYRDDAGAVCRCWNWRDGQRTALTDDSESAFLIIECVDPSRIDDLRAALDEFSQLIERYLGASIEAHAIVDRSNPEVVIVD